MRLGGCAAGRRFLVLHAIMLVGSLFEPFDSVLPNNNPLKMFIGAVRSALASSPRRPHVPSAAFALARRGAALSSRPHRPSRAGRPRRHRVQVQRARRAYEVKHGLVSIDDQVFFDEEETPEEEGAEDEEGAEGAAAADGSDDAGAEAVGEGEAGAGEDDSAQ